VVRGPAGVIALGTGHSRGRLGARATHTHTHTHFLATDKGAGSKGSGVSANRKLTFAAGALGGRGGRTASRQSLQGGPPYGLCDHTTTAIDGKVVPQKRRAIDRAWSLPRAT
jgi:hypothetical protein